MKDAGEFDALDAEYQYEHRPQKDFAVRPALFT